MSQLKPSNAGMAGSREQTHSDRFPAKNDKALRTLHEEAGELVAEDTLDLICLLDANADADTVD